MVITALAMFAMAAMLTFAIDVPHWFNFSRNLQNQADAAAFAAGDQLGNMCAGNPTNPLTSPENAVGEMAQLFSGPRGSNADLPYGYSGTGSPLDASGSGPLAAYWAGQPGVTPSYENIPNLRVKNDTNGANYHLILNGNNYATSTPAGTNFAIGDFCHGDPTLDRTDKECFGQTKPLTGQLASDCATGAMVDVKVTQGDLPQFVPLFGFRPNISAHARVFAQGIGEANNLKPLGVKDAGVVPCVRVTFLPTGGATAPQTVQLAVNKSLTGSTGPIYWDNSGNNAGAGNSISIPSGANVYMKATLYAPGVSGTCSTLGSPIDYEGSSGILYLNSYGTTLPTSTDAPRIIGNATGGGVTLLNGGCSHDQYFSNNTGTCSPTVCAIVAFTPGSTNQDVTISINGAKAKDMTQVAADPACPAVAGATAWEFPLTVAPSSGQMQFDLGWKEKASGVCNNNCSGDFGVQQQAFSACNEDFNSACGGDPNISGPIVQAYITDTGSGLGTVGSFQGGTSHNLVIRLALQGLQDSPRTDRCSNGLTQCTLLRVDQGNADGMVDCGQGNGASASRLVILYGCPLAGQTATAANPVPCSSGTSALYCGGWMVTPTGTPDGVCNNATRTGTSPVDCINTNNNGATMPQCVQALVVAAGANNGVVDYSQITDSNCHVNGTTCSENRWLTGAPIVPGVTADPRIITTFIVYQGDISGATGNHDMQIRTFASFYVTGWQIKPGGGSQAITCTGAGTNEPPPSTLPNNADAIWGHWITYTEPGAGGNGTPCDFNAFGDCAVVLTR